MDVGIVIDARLEQMYGDEFSLDIAARPDGFALAMALPYRITRDTSDHNVVSAAMEPIAWQDRLWADAPCPPVK